MKSLISALLVPLFLLHAQQDSIPTQYDLKEVIVSSSRIEIPFAENARTLQIISSQELKATGASAFAAIWLYCSGCKCDLEPEILSDPGGCLQPFKSRVFGDQFGTHAGAQCKTFSAIQLLKELV